MKRKSLCMLFACIIVACSCHNATEQKQVQDNGGNKSSSKDSSVGKIEWYDASASRLIDSNARLEVIASGYTWSEGPVWIPAKKMLLFTDVPENKIYQWKEGDTASLYLTPSGYTGLIDRDGGEDGANGLALDTKGHLLLCQSGNRQVVRLNTPLDSPKPAFTVLSPNFNGKKYNSPNDLVVDSKNNIYFTDPIYGLPKRADDPTRELKFEGVYKIDAANKTTLLIDSITNPNGIGLSPDEKTLYVASSEEKHPKWFAYQLDDKGNIKSGGVLLDGTDMQTKATVKQGGDGFKLDKDGNIFCAGPDGISIISPSGKLLGLIKIYVRRVSNCAFDETKSTLFITADDIVIKVKLHA